MKNSLKGTSPAQESAILRRRILWLMSKAETDQSAVAALCSLITSGADRAMIASCLENHYERSILNELLETRDLALLRSRLQGASRLLLRACAHEGLSVSAVAYGILPRPHLPLSCEGYPWGVRSNAISKRSRPLRDLKAGVRAGDGGTEIRPSTHPAGRWMAYQRSCVLTTSYELGRVRFRSKHDGTAGVLIREERPDMFWASLVGRNMVPDVVEHPVLDDPDFHVIRVDDIGRCRKNIVFNCPIDPLSFDSLPRHPDTDHQQIGRDGSLTGEDALFDVLKRLGGYNFGLYDDQQMREVSKIATAFGPFRAHIRAINLMAPPWTETLPVAEHEMRFR